MARHWLVRGLGLLLLLCVVAGGWASVPFLLSFENIETKFRKFANNRGFEIEIGSAPRLVMTPFPEVALGAIRLTGADGDLVLEGEDARLAPSPWMLVSADAMAGRLALADARITLPATALSPPVRLQDAALAVSLGAGGELDGSFSGQAGGEPVSGDFWISDLDALLDGRVTVLALDLEAGARVAAYDGTLRIPPGAGPEPVPDLVGKLTFGGLDIDSVAVRPWISALLREMSTVELTSQINLSAERLSVSSLAWGSLRDHPASVAATVTGGPGWVRSGALQGDMTARLGGILSARVTGDLDWRNLAQNGVQGETQLVVLDLPILADWSGMADLARGPLPKLVSLKGDLSWAVDEIAIEDGELRGADLMYKGDGRLTLGGERPQLSIRSGLPRLAWPGIEAVLDDLSNLSNLSAQAANLVVEVDADALAIGHVTARNAEILMHATPAAATFEFRSAKLANGAAKAKLALGADTGRASLTIQLSGPEIEALLPGPMTGSAVGDMQFAWDRGAMEAMTGEGNLSVYAGRLAGVDIGASLLGTEPGREATDFAVVATDVRVADGVATLSPLRISGAGWTAEGEVRLDMADRTVSGILRPAQPGAGGDVTVEISTAPDDLSLAVSSVLATGPAAPATEPLVEDPNDASAPVIAVPAIPAALLGGSEPNPGNAETARTAAANAEATEAVVDDTPPRQLTAIPPIPQRAPR